MSLSGLGCDKYDIKATSRATLNDIGTNINEDVEYLREGVCNTLGESHTDKTRERERGCIKTHALDPNDAF